MWTIEHGLLVFCGICAGYILGRWASGRRRAQEERGRVVAALAGLPDWERTARAMESEAAAFELQGMSFAASIARAAADRTRKLGRERHG